MQTVDNASKKKQESVKEPCIYVYLQETKKPCENLQGENLPPRGVERPSNEPCFYGISDDAENSTPRFTTRQDYFNQILSLFDELDADQQSELLEVIQARIQMSAGMHR